MFHYFPPDEEGLFATLPALSTAPFASPFPQPPSRVNVKVRATTLPKGPPLPVMTSSSSSSSSSPRAFTTVDRFHVSPVFHALGHLWQWRAVLLHGGGEVAATAHEGGGGGVPPRAASPLPRNDHWTARPSEQVSHDRMDALVQLPSVAKSPHLPILNTPHVPRAVANHPPASYVLLPFLLLPAGIVDPRMPLISRAAFEEVMMLCDGSLDGPRSPPHSSPFHSKAATRGRDGKVMSTPCGAGDLMMGGRRSAGSAARSLMVPSALGILQPHIYADPSSDRSHGSGGGTPDQRIRNGRGGSAQKGTLTPPSSSYSLRTEKRGCRAIWASSYFDLLDLFHEWEDATDETVTREGWGPGSPPPEKRCPTSPLVDQLRQHGWAARVEPTSVLSPNVVAQLNHTLRSLPPRREDDTPQKYAERCWRTFVEGAGEKDHPMDYPGGGSDARLHDWTGTRRSVGTGAAPVASPAARDDPWRRRVPPCCRNVIGGGLAELIISLDRYAALVSRGEVPLSSACWAILCDTANPDIVAHIRYHAVELEVEVIAAVRAHRHAMRAAMQNDKTLVGKGCNGSVSLWGDHTASPP